MYSPKIEEELVPILYHTAKERKMPMTTFVNYLIVNGLVRETLPSSVQGTFSEYLVNRHYRDHPDEFVLPGQ